MSKTATRRSQLRGTATALALLAGLTLAIPAHAVEGPETQPTTATPTAANADATETASETTAVSTPLIPSTQPTTASDNTNPEPTENETSTPTLPSLDFASIVADEAEFLIPEAAKQFQQPDGTYRIGRPTPGGKGAGQIVPELAEFYNQKLVWSSCEPFTPDPGKSYAAPGTECAYLIVPVDYDNPQGPTIAIGLYKVKATRPDKRIGTLFQDPGGPGGSGMEAASTFARNGSGVVKERFDYVGFDPRGVGSSLPMIRCYSSDAFDKQRADADHYDGDKKNAILSFNTSQCYENTGKGFGINGKDFISTVGTRHVVKDLDIARAVLGDNKINYLGYSYGTSIGYHYAKAFPNNIRSIVIDGVMNPFENNPEAAQPFGKYTATTSSGLIPEIAQLKGFQETLNEYFKACAAGNGFDDPVGHTPCATGTDPDKALAKYQEIARSVWQADEVFSEDGRRVTFADVTQATIAAMYSEENWPILNIALAYVEQEREGTFVMLLADDYFKRGGDGKYGFTQSAFQTIWCTDYGVVEGNNAPGAAQARLAKQYEVAPFTDPGVDKNGQQRGLRAEHDWCTYYDVTHTLPKGEELTALPNILVISTTYDSATPYQDGVVAADAMDATLLTVAGSNHTSYRPGTDTCTAQITEKYLTDLVVPTDITGAKNVETKDIYSQVITGDECQVHSFRPTPTLEARNAVRGGFVTISATGLVRGQEYVVSLPDDLGASVTVRANDQGIATTTVRVPSLAALGESHISLRPAYADENDPRVSAEAVLVVSDPAIVVTPVGPQAQPEEGVTAKGAGVTRTLDVGIPPVVSLPPLGVAPSTGSTSRHEPNSLSEAVLNQAGAGAVTTVPPQTSSPAGAHPLASSANGAALGSGSTAPGLAATGASNLTTLAGITVVALVGGTFLARCRLR